LTDGSFSAAGAGGAQAWQESAALEARRASVSFREVVAGYEKLPEDARRGTSVAGRIAEALLFGEPVRLRGGSPGDGLGR
jgi:hypothetical protein